jgi:hypothetical protein
VIKGTITTFVNFETTSSAKNTMSVHMQKVARKKKPYQLKILQNQCSGWPCFWLILVQLSLVISIPWLIGKPHYHASRTTPLIITVLLACVQYRFEAIKIIQKYTHLINLQNTTCVVKNEMKHMSNDLLLTMYQANMHHGLKNQNQQI